MKIKDVLDPYSLAFLLEGKYATITDENKFLLNLRVFYDNRHSWLEVPTHLVVMLDLSPSDFSQYSRIDSKHRRIYLDEDIDIGVFMERVKEWPKSERRKDTLDAIEEVLGEDEDTGWQTVKDLELAGNDLLDSINIQVNKGADFVRNLGNNSQGQSIH
tara:strand:- start:187 stop:663 length:477 start_codon:yes stop_codon:yes gene_type:complete